MAKCRIWGSNGSKTDITCVYFSLSALVPKLKEQQVQMIIDRLAQFSDANNTNAELRDISSTGTYSFEIGS